MKPTPLRLVRPALHSLCVLCLLLLTTPSLSNPVYVTLDKEGTPRYSDRPSKNARLTHHTFTLTPRLSLPQAVIEQTVKVSAQKEKSSPLPSPKNTPSAKAMKSAQPPIKLTISTPYNKQSILSNSGSLQVTTITSPTLPANHNLQLLLNRKPLSKQQDTTFELTNLERGAHQLQLLQLDENGKVIAKSPTVRFYVRKSTKTSPK